jgi:hypothetical protein
MVAGSEKVLLDGMPLVRGADHDYVIDYVRGTLKVGQYADLIATPDNPLTNIQTLKQVSFVMKNGVVVPLPGKGH